MTAEHDTDTPEPCLNSTEIRVLGCLIEKQATHPETYPLTLNALVLACNQKTSREPVMNLSQGQVGQSLRVLEGQGFTRLVMGSRADRWEHRVDKALELVPAQVILIGLLFLRGPQTVNELLTRSGRMHDFEDAEQVVHQPGTPDRARAGAAGTAPGGAAGRPLHPCAGRPGGYRGDYRGARKPGGARGWSVCGPD